MRTAAAIFVALHGLGHIIWFMSSWAQKLLGSSGRAEVAKHRGQFLIQPTTAAGRIVGIVSLLVLVAFLATAWGIWTEAAWWPAVLIPSAIASLFTLVAIWNPVGTVSLNALLANIGLSAATLMPWGERFLGAH